MDPAALTRCLTYIQANLDGDLSLEALAAVAGCSSPYFARRFADMMAETPKQYTSRLRLERAALRLVLLDDGILDIALDCGFSCHETFSRAFRRRFGVAPHVFRNRGRLPVAAEEELPQRVDAATPVSDAGRDSRRSGARKDLRTSVGHQRFAGGLFEFTTCVAPFASLPAAYKKIFGRVRSDRSLACLGVPCLEFYRVNRVVADLAIVNTEIAIPVRRHR